MIRSVTSSDQERSCILLLRLQAAGGAWRWVHCVLQLKDAQETSATISDTQTESQKKEIEPSSATEKRPPSEQPQPSPSDSLTQTQATTESTTSQVPNSQQSIIVATNQVVGEREAAVLRANPWLYHYYSMQSKLQYNLAYEAQRVQAYYPQMMQYQADAGASYMNQYSLNVNPATGYTPSTHPHYSSINSSPYIQHYHHHYPLRLHPGFDYSRTHHGYMNFGDQPSSLSTNVPAPQIGEQQSSHIEHQQHQQTHQQQQQHQPQYTMMESVNSTSRVNRKTNPVRPTSRRNSPVNGVSTNGVESGGVAVAAPVAVRPSFPTQNKGIFQQITEDLEINWKASPIQVVPDYSDYTPYVTPPYSKAPSPVKVTGTDSPSPEFADQRVPSVGGIEAAWLTELQTRAHWIPADDHHTASLRMFHQAHSYNS